MTKSLLLASHILGGKPFPEACWDFPEWNLRQGPLGVHREVKKHFPGKETLEVSFKE